jgi:hypothetical protein
MLFLYRPRQTWMPYQLPRNRMQQSEYNRHLQAGFEATRRLPPSTPSVQAPVRDASQQLRDLADLRNSGAITDDEFTSAKAKVLGSDTPDR